MGVDTGVARCACKVFVLTVRDVDVRFGVSVLLGQAKVNDIDLICPLSKAHEEVVWLNIPVDEAL